MIAERILRLSAAAGLVTALACGGPGGTYTESGEESTSAGEYIPPTPDCDPLAQDCPLEQACYFVAGDRGFGCETPADSPGGFGDPCQYPQNCDKGLDCGPGEVTPGCAQGFGCCTMFCEVGGDPCPGGLDCKKLYAEGAPPGYENVGLCKGTP